MGPHSQLDVSPDVGPLQTRRESGKVLQNACLSETLTYAVTTLNRIAEKRLGRCNRLAHTRIEVHVYERSVPQPAITPIEHSETACMHIYLFGISVVALEEWKDIGVLITANYTDIIAHQ